MLYIFKLTLIFQAFGLRQNYCIKVEEMLKLRFVAATEEIIIGH